MHIKKTIARLKNNGLLIWIMLLFSLAGFGLFYLIPFIVSFVYSVWNNPISREYCGFQNYTDLFRNIYFLRGLRNTAIFMGIAIPLNICLSLAAALVIRKIKWYPKVFCLVFLIPLAVPSAASAFFWENFWGLHGALNKFLSTFGIRSVDWLDCRLSMAVIVLIFIWKNIGYDMVLFLSGLSSIPEDYYKYAEMEGAGRFWKFRHITFVYLTPTAFPVLIMTFVNCFKVFKEIYIITGDYPPENLYVLQHFMNNMFLSLNYPKLVSAVYLLTIVVVLFAAVIFGIERNVSNNLHD